MTHKDKVIADLKNKFKYNPGYFYRDKNKQAFFQPTDWYNKPAICLSGSPSGDPLCMLPLHYLREGFIPWNDPNQERWDKVYTDITHIIETDTVTEYFFPYEILGPVSKPGEISDKYEKVKLSYYVIGTKLWEEYEETGMIDEKWLFALACSVYHKDGGLKNGKLEGTYDALTYQILTADTREKQEVIMELLRPPQKGDVITIPCDNFDHEFEPIVFGECSFFDKNANKDTS